jgi:hypothetical protein
MCGDWIGPLTMNPIMALFLLTSMWMDFRASLDPETSKFLFFPALVHGLLMILANQFDRQLILQSKKKWIDPPSRYVTPAVCAP